MYKILIAVSLLTPLTLAQHSINFYVDSVVETFDAFNHNDKTRWVLTEDKYVGRHPCSYSSVCECWLERATLGLSVNCSQRNLHEPPTMYKGLRIYELDLSGNALRQAPNMTSEGYNLVERLNLSENRIGSINEDLISTNLEVLLLKNNHITHIDKAVLNRIENKSNIKWLDLNNNPFTCNCEAAALLNFLRNSNIPRLFHVVCADADDDKRAQHLATNTMCPGKLANFFKELHDESN